MFLASEFAVWKEKWFAILSENGGFEKASLLMKEKNPRVIPRNYWIENALEEMVKGNQRGFENLLKILQNPYGEQGEEFEFEKVQSDCDLGYQTFCGT